MWPSRRTIGSQRRARLQTTGGGARTGSLSSRKVALHDPHRERARPAERDRPGLTIKGKRAERKLGAPAVKGRASVGHARAGACEGGEGFEQPSFFLFDRRRRVQSFALGLRWCVAADLPVGWTTRRREALAGESSWTVLQDSLRERARRGPSADRLRHRLNLDETDGGNAVGRAHADSVCSGSNRAAFARAPQEMQQKRPHQAERVVLRDVRFRDERPPVRRAAPLQAPSG